MAADSSAASGSLCLIGRVRGSRLGGELGLLFWLLLDLLFGVLGVDTLRHRTLLDVRFLADSPVSRFGSSTPSRSSRSDAVQ